MSTEPLQQEGYDFMAAAFAVYNDMGNGYTEDIYQESIEMELADKNIPFRSQVELTIRYQGRPLKKKFRPDLLVFEDMVVELKAASALTSSTRHNCSIISRPPASPSAIWPTSVTVRSSNGNVLSTPGRLAPISEN